MDLALLRPSGADHQAFWAISTVIDDQKLVTYAGIMTVFYHMTARFHFDLAQTFDRTVACDAVVVITAR